VSKACAYMDYLDNFHVKSTWIPTWHPMDHASWSFALFPKTTS
jgi:hypothetical protein